MSPRPLQRLCSQRLLAAPEQLLCSLDQHRLGLQGSRLRPGLADGQPQDRQSRSLVRQRLQARPEVNNLIVVLAQPRFANGLTSRQRANNRIAGFKLSDKDPMRLILSP